jgi:crotonobetainyl-CoA:carnitine CoA-transferase CaiB-like acyl-CoA transferase
MPELPWQFLDNGAGKRSALLDVRTSPGKARFEQLLREADVLVTGYRPGALADFGLDPRRLAADFPGLVIARLSAWGPVGPWANRRGFDSIVQAATGISWVESVDGKTPGALPAQALDHGAGHLLAAAVLVALSRQANEGGTWLVETSLVAMARLLLDSARSDGSQDGPASWDDCLTECDTPSGRLRYALPAVLLDGGPKDYPSPGRVWGADPPTW